MMKLYGIDVSFPANKVRYVANYLGVSYDFEHMMPFSDESRSDKYRQLNPTGKVPAIDDDGFTLFESNAIIRYLAAKAESPLYPTELRQRAQVDQWIDFVSIHIGGAIARVFWNTIGVRFMNEEPDENSLAAGRGFLARFLPVVDGQLATTRYLAGSELTLADFNLLATLDPTDFIGVDLSEYTAILKWRRQLQTEPFYDVDRSFGQQMLANLMAQ